MRVILLQDIENLGKKYDLKQVADGYARNFLIPKGLAKIVTKQALKWLEVQREIEDNKDEEALKKVQAVANKIEGIEIVMSAKVGDKGELFEGITAQKLSEKLKGMNFDIKKSQINLAEPIKELGEFPIKINFEHKLEAEVTLIVNELIVNEQKQS